MDEVGDSDILVHWLELNLSRKLIGKIYGVSLMPETYVEWKALAERLDAQQCCFDGVIAQQNSTHPILPATNCLLPPPNHFTPSPCPFLACTPAPPTMPHPTHAGDAMVVDHAHAPGVLRSCFQCGQASHMVRECPLLDMHPQTPRPQVCAVESQACDAEDYENEIALL